MRKLIVVLLGVAGSSLVFAQAAKTDTASIEKAIMQMERDWTEAGIKRDAKTFDKIVADDWVGLDFLGKSVSKAQALANMKSGASSSQTVDLTEMKVRVFGNTAVVTGSDIEKSTYNSKDSSGKYVWTDVFVNRNGKWQAVSSQSTKVEK